MSRSILNKTRYFLRKIERFGSFHLLGTNFFINFLGFGSQLLIAKFISPIDLGRIKTMQSFVAVAVIAAGFGLNTAILKLCSEKRPLDEKKRILKDNLNITAAVSILTVTLIGLLSFLHWLSPDLAINEFMLAFMWIIPPTALTMGLICYLQALKKIKLMAKSQVLIRLFGVAFLVIATYYWKILGFIVATIIIRWVALVPLLWLARIKWDFQTKLTPLTRLSLGYGKWSMASNGMNALRKYLDLFILNYFLLNRSLLGDYGLAAILILALDQVTLTVQNIATPYFSEKSQDPLAFKQALSKYQRLLIATAFILTGGAVLIGPKFISFIYQDKYPLTGVFFQILTLRYFFGSCQALLGIALITLGRIKDNFIISCIALPVTIGFSIWFIRLWGPFGAAWAQVAGAFISMIIFHFKSKKIIHDAFATPSHY